MKDHAGRARVIWGAESGSDSTGAPSCFWSLALSRLLGVATAPPYTALNLLSEKFYQESMRKMANGIPFPCDDVQIMPQNGAASIHRDPNELKEVYLQLIKEKRNAMRAGGGVGWGSNQRQPR